MGLYELAEGLHFSAFHLFSSSSIRFGNIQVVHEFHLAGGRGGIVRVRRNVKKVL